MKPKEEMSDDKSSVPFPDWHWISWMPFLCPQIDWHYAELMFGFAQPFPPTRESYFDVGIIFALFYVQCEDKAKRTDVWLGK